jgi:hypothetical protein
VDGVRAGLGDENTGDLSQDVIHVTAPAMFGQDTQVPDDRDVSVPRRNTQADRLAVWCLGHPPPRSVAVHLVPVEGHVQASLGCRAHRVSGLPGRGVQAPGQHPAEQPGEHLVVRLGAEREPARLSWQAGGPGPLEAEPL